MNHFKESKRIYRIKIKGVYDINGESMERAAKAGLYTYSSRSELINDSDVDLVLIAVPNHLHKFHPDLSPINWNKLAQISLNSVKADRKIRA